MLRQVYKNGESILPMAPRSGPWEEGAAGGVRATASAHPPGVAPEKEGGPSTYPGIRVRVSAIITRTPPSQNPNF